MGNLTFSSLFSSFVFSVIGMWMLAWAKKRANLKILVIALALMIYPYFTHGPLADWGVGLLLCGLAHHFWWD